MVGTSNIVARDDGSESRSAILAGGLQASECVRLDGSSGAITVALSLNTGVDTCGIAAPKLNISISDGLAAGGVDDVDVQVSDGTSLASQNVRADEFSSHPCGLSVPGAKSMRLLMLTIWALRRLGIECTSRLDTIFRLNLR